MAYHRFYTPVGIFTSSDGLGVYRETCIDEITFDENGYMQITPTLEGVGPVFVKGDEPQPEPTLDEIKITGPTKTKYIQGEELDLSGLVVTAVYSDGSEVEIQVDDYTVSGYNSNVVGTQTITVTYEGKTATFSVTVEEDKQPTDPTDPTDPSKPTDPDQPSDTRGGKDQQTGGADQSTDGGDKSKTVQTGDTTNVAGTAAVCVIALGMAGAVIYIRRKRQ